MRQLPTDCQLLQAIYDRYYADFVAWERGERTRSSHIMVPVDVDKLGKDLKVDPELVFGRLYYDLEQRYGYAHDERVRVHFFALRVGSDTHCVNFPYLAGVLAKLDHECRKYWWPLAIAIVSACVSAGALLISLLRS